MTSTSSSRASPKFRSKSSTTRRTKTRTTDQLFDPMQVAYPKIAEDMRQIMAVLAHPPDIDLAEWAEIHARTKDGNDYRPGDMSDPWISFRRRCCIRTKPC